VNRLFDRGSDEEKSGRTRIEQRGGGRHRKRERREGRGDQPPPHYPLGYIALSQFLFQARLSCYEGNFDLVLYSCV